MHGIKQNIMAGVHIHQIWQSKSGGYFSRIYRLQTWTNPAHDGNMVEKKTRRQGEDAVRQGEKEYAEAKARLEEIDRIIVCELRIHGGKQALGAVIGRAVDRCV